MKSINEFNVSISYFKDIIDEFAEIYAKQHKISTGKAFAIWYFLLIEGFPEDLVDKIVIDGAGDAGIDAIYYNDVSKVLTYYQFKNPKINKTATINDIVRFIDGVNSFRETVAVTNKKTNHEKYFNQELKNLIAENSLY